MSEWSVLVLDPELQFRSPDDPMPFLAGLENEFGVSVWDFYKELLSKTQRYVYDEPIPGEPVHSMKAEELTIIMGHLPDGVARAREYLSNGSRLYVDQGHPEYSTPECRSIRELLLAHAAGELLLYEMFERAKNAGVMSKFMLNTILVDNQNNTWGAHENYLIPPNMSPEIKNVYMPLASHLAARQIYTSAYDAHRNRLSQRSQFIREVVGEQTIENRAIVNTRDERHGAMELGRRLHIICGDATQLPAATALRVGMTNIVCRLISHGVKLEHLYLKRPVKAFQQFGSDMTLQSTATTIHDKEVSARNIEEEFVTLARKMDDAYGILTPDEREVLDLQEKVNDRLAANPSYESLLGVSDFAEKLAMMQKRPDKAAAISIGWGMLGSKGLAQVIRNKKQCEMPLGFSMEAAREYIHKAPEGRAAIRGQLVRIMEDLGLSHKQRSADFSHLSYRDWDDNRHGIWLSDPLGSKPTDKEIAKWIKMMKDTVENTRVPDEQDEPMLES